MNTCIWCQSQFILPERRIREGRAGKFCKITCYHEYKRKYKTVSHVCKSCSKQFSIPVSEERKGGGKFCSWKCRTRKVTLYCEMCGKTMEKHPSDLRYFANRFCSQPCYKKTTVSSQELKLKAALDERRIDHIHQAPIAWFVVDFIIGNVAVEVDGRYWHSERFPLTLTKDRRKKTYLRKMGYTVLTLTDEQVDTDLQGCIDSIASKMKI